MNLFVASLAFMYIIKFTLKYKSLKKLNTLQYVPGVILPGVILTITLASNSQLVSSLL